MTRTMTIALAALGSLALLVAALGFQYLGGLPPCKLCYWQRYPHIAAVLIGGLAMKTGSRALCGLGALAAATSAAVGVYHTGVERGWWQGPDSCTSGAIDGLSTDQLMEQIMSAPLVRCDEVPWELFTLSMASWNAIASALLALLWLRAALMR